MSDGDEALLRSLGSFLVVFDNAVTDANKAHQPRTVGPIHLTGNHFAALQRRANTAFQRPRFEVTRQKEWTTDKWLITMTPV
jgi:hypothetical protein